MDPPLPACSSVKLVSATLAAASNAIVWSVSPQATACPIRLNNNGPVDKFALRLLLLYGNPLLLAFPMDQVQRMPDGMDKHTEGLSYQK